MTTPHPDPDRMVPVETYREVEILAVDARGERRYRIEASIAELVDYAGSNEDLEEDLALLAERADKAIAWDSEGDTLVATAPI